MKRLSKKEILSLDEYDRIELAKKGKYLNILVHDKCWFVRYHCASHGYRLDLLINDEHNL